MRLLLLLALAVPAALGAAPPAPVDPSLLISKLPALRRHVQRSWCPQYLERRASISMFDSLEGDVATRLCPNPGTSGYVCKILRIWRTLVPHTVQGMKELGIWPQGFGGAGGEGLDLYTFGVFFGDSMYFFRSQFPQARLLGFDSFTGLPSEKRGEVNRRGWVAGTFNTHLPRLVVQRLREDLGDESTATRSDGRRRKTLIRRGFFNQSLTPQLAESARAAGPLIIDVDSDIYVSAYQACLFGLDIL